MTEDIDYILQSRSSEDSFIAFVGDNVDHDIATLDGKKTFHGMEAIAAITNKGNFIAKRSMYLRPTSYTKVNELVQKKGMPITSNDIPSHRGLHLMHMRISYMHVRISANMDRL